MASEKIKNPLIERYKRHWVMKPINAGKFKSPRVQKNFIEFVKYIQKLNVGVSYLVIKGKQMYPGNINVVLLCLPLNEGYEVKFDVINNNYTEITGSKERGTEFHFPIDIISEVEIFIPDYKED